jgi:hypothetical protein
LPGTDHFGDLAHQPQIHQTVGGIGGRLHHDETDPAAARRSFFHRLLGGIEHRRTIVALIEAHRANAKSRQGLFDQSLGAAVQRLAHQNHVARPHVIPDDGGYGRHAAGKYRRRLALLPQRQTILQYFQIRIVEARIHQPG